MLRELAFAYFLLLIWIWVNFFPASILYFVSTHTRNSNFAGVLGPLSPTVDLSLEEWQKCMDVNCNGVFLSTKHELRQMMKQESIEV
jgi:hypothetical protein